ncbi:MAG: TonB C-terminal domain-containing protein [Gemmatimonadales bacterium]
MSRWKAAPERRGSVAAGVVGTFVVHAGMVGLLVAAVKRPVLAPPVYAVELVAAPAPAPEAKRAPEVLERPPTAPPAPVKPAPPKPATKPAPTPPPAPPADQKREPTPRATAPTTPLPGETPSTGTDAVTVKTPGLDFPHPEYLRNIVQQVYRRWDRPIGRVTLRAEVSFFILRDGTVKDIRFTSSSGSFSFDLVAQGAIEAAGNAKAFGMLPDGYEADVLPVSFFFTPRSTP